jgi:uncharacterized protein YegP (UPF0339 family)
MGDGEFQVFEDAAGEWRWRLVGGNGEVVAQSESYTRAEDAERGAQQVSLLASVAEVTRPEDAR